MNSNNREENSKVFNILTLGSFLFGLFLIIFLKRGSGKKDEQAGKTLNKRDTKGQRVDQKGVTPSEKELKKLNARQIQILEMLRFEGSLEPSEIYRLVPNVSTRTVRRDMDSLISSGLVVQKGNTKATTYEYISTK